MRTDRKDLGLRILQEAISIRRRLDLGRNYPVCIYDLAERLGVDVRFTALSQLEGVYSRDPGPVILLGAHRPDGRQRYTCAHEIGHHVLGHENRVDSSASLTAVADLRDETEWAAQVFAGFLLMPRSALMRAFSERGTRPDGVSPLMAYRVARYFGVSYDAIITHMDSTLGVISDTQVTKLRSKSPQEIKRQLLGHEWDRGVDLVDSKWQGRAIDVEIDDLLILENGAYPERDKLKARGAILEGPIYQARKVGVDRLTGQDGWAAYVRVQPQDFTGLSVFRHWE